MKKLLLVIILFSFGLIANAQENPKEVVVVFFEAFHKQDTVKLKDLCHVDLILQTVTNAKEGSRLKTETKEVFFKSISSIPNHIKFFEKIIDYQVRQDGNMYHVWAPYEFYVNEKLSHTGVNSFTIIKESNDKWKIVHLIDTRKKSK